MLPALLCLLIVSAGPPAEVALLVSPPQGDETALHFVRAEQPVEAPAVRFFHQPGAEVKGTVLPGTRLVFAIAQLYPARDPSWASGLVRLEEGQVPVMLADRVFHATRPLVTSSGRLFVQRGRPGAPPTVPELEAGQLRIDSLTIEEIHPRSGEARVVHRFEGYITYLAGSVSEELIVYRVRPEWAELVAVHMDTGRERTLAADIPPFARDFSVNPHRASLLFTNLDPHTGRWQVRRLEVRSGEQQVLAEGTRMSLAPSWWGPDQWVFNPDGRGLTSPGIAGFRTAPAGAGVDFIRGFSADGRWALSLHTEEGTLPAPYALRTTDGAALPLPAPPGARVDLAGWVEAPTR